MDFIDKIIEREKAQGYSPKYLSWTRSYEHEVAEMRELICGEPDDVHMLKREYEDLTGKRFRRRKDYT